MSNLQDIEDSLSSEIDLPASPTLHAAVMRAIHREAARPAPIPFPWPRFALGLVAGSVLCTLVALDGAALIEKL